MTRIQPVKKAMYYDPTVEKITDWAKMNEDDKKVEAVYICAAVCHKLGKLNRTQAARKFNIPKTTFMNHSHGKQVLSKHDDRVGSYQRNRHNLHHYLFTGEILKCERRPFRSRPGEFSPSKDSDALDAFFIDPPQTLSNHSNPVVRDAQELNRIHTRLDNVTAALYDFKDQLDTHHKAALSSLTNLQKINERLDDAARTVRFLKGTTTGLTARLDKLDPLVAALGALLDEHTAEKTRTTMGKPWYRRWT